MNKIIAVVIGFIIIAGGLFVVTKNNSQGASKPNDASKVVTSTASNNTKSRSACELLTLEDAKSLIGSNATLSEGSGIPNLATAESVNVDNCTYSADGATLGDLKQITIQRHYGDTSQVKQAYDNYKKEFPGEALTGLGDTAYYATEAKQVQVLQGDYWLFIFGGSINAGDEANKDLGIKTAQMALKKL